MKIEKIRVIIVEDEPKSRALLCNIIKQRCPKIDIVGLAENVAMSHELIASTKPHLAVMDIKLGDKNAFDLLKKYAPSDFKVIFVTGYSNFAINAFDVQAEGYLLKPIDIDKYVDLLNSIADKIIKENNYGDAIRQNDHTKIVIQQKSGMAIISKEDIIYLQAEGRYTWVFLQNGEKLFSSLNLGTYENELRNGNEQSPFFRTHHGYMVNLNFVSFFDTKDNLLRLQERINVPVSNRKKANLTQKFSRIMN